MTNYEKLLLIFCVFFISCKKSAITPTNIVQSSIDFNQEITKVEEIDSGNVFNATSQYRSYFSSTGIVIDNQFLFVGNRAANDGDLSPADFVFTKTSLNFSTIPPDQLFKSNLAKLNSVTPSLIKIGNKLQFYYLRQESITNSQIYVTESLDSGKSWINDRRISLLDGYNCIINDRVILLSSGRIIIPVSYTTNIDRGYNKQIVFCYYSDDQGLTWSKSQALTSNIPLMEPCIAEVTNGSLLMVIRSQIGKLLFSRSNDNGLTWSVIEKSHLNSPASTSAIYKVDNGVLALVWNNSPPGSHVFDRKPLSLSLSKDEGNTWSIPYTIENNDGEIYTSPGMFKSGHNWIIHYNHSTNAADYGIRAKEINISYQEK